MAKLVGCCALLLAVAAAVSLPESDVGTFGQIVAFKQLADHDLLIGLDQSVAQGHISDGAKDLGDSNQDNELSSKEKQIVEADTAVKLLAKMLSSSDMTQDLGESDDAVRPESDERVPHAEKLKYLLRPTQQKMGKIADRIGHLLDYLGARMMDGQTLSKQEVSAVRAFYLDQTARVLGEYAYDDSLSKKMDAGDGEIYKPVSGDAHRLADEVKHQMDQTDASVHMNKMGIHAHHDAGKGGKGQMMKHMSELMGGGKGSPGGHLNEMMHALMGGKGDPMTDMGPAPRFDRIMQHLEEAGRLADFTDQVERTCRLGDSQHPTLDDLEAKESGITSGIEQLLAKVKAGKLFSHDLDEPKKNNAKPTEQLRSALTQAASKEDDAKIVQQAGAIAEQNIQKTLAKGMALKPKAQPEPTKTELPKEQHRPTVDHSLKALDKTLSGALDTYGKHNAQHKHLTVDEHKEISQQLRSITAQMELHVPVETVRDHSVKALDQTLTHALDLYGKRHAQHKHLSVHEHKQISKQLRSIAAHMMRRLQHRDQKQHEKTPPKAKHAKPEAKHAKPEAKHVEAAAPAAKPAPKEPKPVATPVAVQAKPLVEGTAVKQFVWHVLGSEQPKQGVTAAPTLADMLKKGVTLFGGGKLFFDVHKK